MVISFPVAFAGTIEIPETDTSAVKIMKVLQSAQRGVDIGEEVSLTGVDPVGSVQRSGDSNLKTYCQDKLLSLSDGYLPILAGVGEESVAQRFGRPSCSSGAALIVHGRNEDVVEERSRMLLSENFDWQ